MTMNLVISALNIAIAGCLVGVGYIETGSAWRAYFAILATANAYNAVTLFSIWKRGRP